MELFNTERARFAANALLAVEIAFGTLSFWSHALEKGQPAHYVVALLLTLTFGSISILAAGIVTRAVAAQQAGETVTRGLVALCGGVVVLIAGFMTWHGLTWADAQAELIPQRRPWLARVGKRDAPKPEPTNPRPQTAGVFRCGWVTRSGWTDARRASNVVASSWGMCWATGRACRSK
jgi:hypothetical protein